MNFADILSDIRQVSGLTTKYNATLKRGINHGGELFASAKDWPHYLDRSHLTTADDYATGTVSVTNGNTALTFSGATLTAAMAGRKIRIGDDEAWYDILSVNTGAGTAVMKQPYQGTTDTDATFSIFQDEYRLDANVLKVANLRNTEDGIVMMPLSYLEFDMLNPSPDQYDDPLWFTYIGRRDETYETGTVSSTAGSKTLTGVSTAWTGVLGLGKGSRISIVDTSEVYTVKSVDSDTSITTYEAAVAAASGSTYIAHMNNIRVQVRDIPDAARNLYYRFYRRPRPLVADYDEPDMPLEHHYALVWAGLAVAYDLTGDKEKAALARASFQRFIDLQWLQLARGVASVKAVKQSMDIGDALVGPRYPSSYGRPLVWTPS